MFLFFFFFLMVNNSLFPLGLHRAYGSEMEKNDVVVAFIEKEKKENKLN